MVIRALAILGLLTLLVGCQAQVETAADSSPTPTGPRLLLTPVRASAKAEWASFEVRVRNDLGYPVTLLETSLLVAFVWAEVTTPDGEVLRFPGTRMTPGPPREVVELAPGEEYVTVVGVPSPPKALRGYRGPARVVVSAPAEVLRDGRFESVRAEGEGEIQFVSDVGKGEQRK